MRTLAKGILIALACLAAGFAVTAWRIWSYDASSPGATADAAIVLGGSTWDGVPSPSFAARIDHGVDLYSQGRVAKLILTGGIGPGEQVPLAEAARDYAAGKGVPIEAMILEPWSRITVENLAYAKQLAADHGLASFIVVSDPLHMKRAMRIAEDLGLNAVPSATPRSRIVGRKAKLRFLLRETWFYIWHVGVGRHMPVRHRPTRQ